MLFRSLSTTNATSTGYSGGTNVRATGNVQFDVLHPICQIQEFSETSVTYGFRTTTGQSVDGSEVPYVQEIPFSPCIANENNYFMAPRTVCSEINETTQLAGNKSLTFAMNISSTNPSLSPVIDTTRTSLIAVSNRKIGRAHV